MKPDRSKTMKRGVAAAMAIGIALNYSVPSNAQQSAPQPAATESMATPEAKPAPKALAAWRGKVLAHLAANKRPVAGGPGGVSTVAFSIDRTGRVLSSQVVKSSGSAALDKEAVALTQRASPVPAPPADLSGAKLYLKVPINFSR